MKFVTTKIMGGLGNYLFQIASAYSKSIDDDLIFVLDTSDVLIKHSNPEKYKKNIFKKINFQQTTGSCELYNELSFNYNVLPKFTNNTKMVGYFQSEKYFSHNRKQTLDLFSIDNETNQFLISKYGELLNNKTCSLHVRRGDYLRLSEFHPPQSVDYYKKSVEMVGEDFHFLIFSDDINWCKENLSFIKNKTFIEGNDDYQDLYLMSMCENNIIANSSFSWWGAWLNVNENKKVISPKIWFGEKNKHLNTNDIYCTNWIKL